MVKKQEAAGAVENKDVKDSKAEDTKSKGEAGKDAVKPKDSAKAEETKDVKAKAEESKTAKA